MRSVWIAGVHRDCLLSVQDVELLLDELAQLPTERDPHAPAAASLIEQTLQGGREAPVVTVEPAHRQAVLHALEALLARRRYFSEGLSDLVEVLLDEPREAPSDQPESATSKKAAMEGNPRPPPPSPSDYWLGRCQGFRVSSPAGRVGVVEELRFLSRVDRPDALAVRAGLAGRRLLIVPVEDVAEIVPHEQRVILRSAPPVKGRLRLLRLALGWRRRAGNSRTQPPRAAAT